MRRLGRSLALLFGGLLGLYLIVVLAVTLGQRLMIYPGAVAAWRRVGPPPAGSIWHAVTVTSADGNPLTAWQANGFQRGRGVFVLFHGNASSLGDMAGLGAALHQRGFGVVIASYRGYSGNPGHPSEAGLMADARAQIDLAARMGGPVWLWGSSLGTGVVARMASEGRASAVVLESPFTSVEDVAAQDWPILPVRWLIWDRFPILDLVPKLTQPVPIPIQIIASAEDPITPAAMARQLAAAIGPSARLLVFPQGPHCPFRPWNMPLIAGFLDRAVPAPPSRACQPGGGCL